MICFKAVHFAAPFIRQNSNSPLCQTNCGRAGCFIGRSKLESVTGRIGCFNVTWGEQRSNQAGVTQDRKPKSNQTTGSARTDFLHRLVFLLPLGTEKPSPRCNRLTELSGSRESEIIDSQNHLNRDFTEQGFSWHSGTATHS